MFVWMSLENGRCNFEQIFLISGKCSQDEDYQKFIKSKEFGIEGNSLNLTFNNEFVFKSTFPQFVVWDLHDFWSWTENWFNLQQTFENFSCNDIDSPTYISWNCHGLQCIHVALQFKKLSKSSNSNREKEQSFILTQIHYLLKLRNNLFSFEMEHFTIFFGLSFIQFTLISFVYFSNLKNGVYWKFPRPSTIMHHISIDGKKTKRMFLYSCSHSHVLGAATSITKTNSLLHLNLVLHFLNMIFSCQFMSDHLLLPWNDSQLITFSKTLILIINFSYKNV